MDIRQPLTSTEFITRYNLLKPLAEGSIRSLSAAAAATGDVVMVHYLIGSSEENDAILDALDRLAPADRKQVVEGFVIESNHVVVTRFLSGFTSLGDWLSDHIAPPTTGIRTAPEATAAATLETPAAPQERVVVEGGAKDSGEFTRLFGAPQFAAPQVTAPQVTAPQVTAPQVTAPQATAPKAAAPQPAAPKPAATSEPGEFTRLFGGYQARATPAPANQAPATPAPAPVAPPAPLPPPAIPPFPTAASSPPPPPPPPAPARPAIRTPSVVPVPGAAPIDPQPPAPLPPPLAQTPPPAAPAPLQGASAQSEYTRLIASATPVASPVASGSAAPAAPSQPTAPPAPAATPADASKRPSYLPLIVTLNIVVLAAIALVLYFVLRH